MRNFLKSIFFSLLIAVLNPGAIASDKSTPEQAMAMTKQAVSYLASHGKEKAFAAFSDPSGPFVKGDLYIMVYDMEGNNKAHGQNPKLIGKNLLDIKDANGVQIVKEFIKTAQTKGKGWVDYKWPNKVTNAVENKSTYIEKTGDILIGVGVYK